MPQNQKIYCVFSFFTHIHPSDENQFEPVWSDEVGMQGEHDLKWFKVI